MSAYGAIGFGMVVLPFLCVIAACLLNVARMLGWRESLRLAAWTGVAMAWISTAAFLLKAG